MYGSLVVDSRLWGMQFHYLGLSCHAPHLPLTAPPGVSTRTRVQTCIPSVARQILNHWTTREVLKLDSSFSYSACNKPGE